MRFLPVFLDLQSGPILLVGAGELVRAKLRLLLAAGARIRWYATDGNRDVGGVSAADLARIDHRRRRSADRRSVRRDRHSLRRRRRCRRRDVGARQGASACRSM